MEIRVNSGGSLPPTHSIVLEHFSKVSDIKIITVNRKLFRSVWDIHFIPLTTRTESEWQTRLQIQMSKLQASGGTDAFSQTIDTFQGLTTGITIKIAIVGIILLILAFTLNKAVN